MAFKHAHQHYSKKDIARIATEAMVERGLEPEFSEAAIQQLEKINTAAVADNPEIFDLVDLLWCSLDNDDSMDLDQLTSSQVLKNGLVKIFVAVADVDALVKKDSALDEHAKINTASIYTSARIFPMLPEKLSTNLTSLNQDEDRLAVVTEMVINKDGSIHQSHVYRAKVRNKAKLAYDAVSDWIEKKGPAPEALSRVKGMQEQLIIQDKTAQILRRRRHEQGCLELEIFQPKAIFDGEQVVAVQQQVQNRGRQLIEEFMIATNECTAKFLAAQGHASLRRVVRSPESWLRIVELAKKYNEQLPSQPNSKALATFLAKRHKADPLRFPDLSLVVVKLMGSGEYVVEQPNAEPIGHFGLAVQDYTHSTAPNRRYPDLITLRMIKGALQNTPPPYSNEDLKTLAEHCSQQEDAARKVERRVRKSEAALLLSSHLNQTFDAVVTGSSSSATWVRILDMPIEGLLEEGEPNLDVGRKLRVRLVSVNVEKGFIDFIQVS
ncbi:MAG: RNB domain-containing ribonuclease [Candidatus Methylopumilus sp.]